MCQLPTDENKKDATNEKTDSSVPPTAEKPIPDTSEKNNTVTNCSKYDGYCQQNKSWPSWIVAICTFVIVVITGYYAHYAGQQVSQMKRTVKTMISQNRLDQRAWLGIVNIVAKGEIEKLQSIEIRFSNTGKTPAKNVTIIIKSKPLPWNSDPDFKEIKPSETDSKMVVVPTQTIINTYKFDEPFAKFTAAESLGIINGKLFVACYGIITYEDIFSVHHWLRFCGYIAGDSKDFHYYHKYNDTDNN